MIQSSGKTLLSLINDILDLSKIEAGKIELKTKKLSVKKVLQDTHKSISNLAEIKKHNIDIKIDEKLMVWADEFRLKQCLNNLLSNAIKFTEDGGRISIKAKKTDGMVEFSVSDTGRGIPTDKIETIFQQFQQTDLIKDTSEGGVGLGLAITKSLIEIMNGEIWVESKVGKGSTFYFTLPSKKLK